MHSSSTRRNGFVLLADVAPTILRLVGEPRPKSMNGRPFVARLRRTGRRGAPRVEAHRRDAGRDLPRPCADARRDHHHRDRGAGGGRAPILAWETRGAAGVVARVRANSVRRGCSASCPPCTSRVCSRSRIRRRPRTTRSCSASRSVLAVALRPRGRRGRSSTRPCSGSVRHRRVAVPRRPHRRAPPAQYRVRLHRHDRCAVRRRSATSRTPSSARAPCSSPVCLRTGSVVGAAPGSPSR